MPFSFFRTWNLIILSIVFFGFAYVLWRVLVLPWDYDPHLTLHINNSPLPFYWLFRGYATIQLALTFVFFRNHCVIANREESTKIVTRG